MCKQDREGRSEGGRKRQREADIKEAKIEDYNVPLFS